MERRLNMTLTEDGTWFILTIVALAEDWPVLEITVTVTGVALMLHLWAYLALKAQGGSMDDGM
jgi:hypothetical protein